ncbi:hypothetical protein BKA66DRAFT_150644 [Pyrenochaeta sp. MPI-SDFR-AT-0127]|nr:hypothetical protein BKA66DRAFT_150644 [Pyrenochaeta sp. MPI-SDFR-AT-0127]
MALTAVQPAMNLEGKSLHPFFSKPSKPQDPDQTPPTTEALVIDPHGDTDYDHNDTSPRSGEGRKKRARKADGLKDKKAGGLATKNQPSLEQFTRPLQAQNASEAACSSHVLAEPSLEEDPNKDRRKRQKTASPGLSVDPPMSEQLFLEHVDWHQQQAVEARKPAEMEISTQVLADIDAPMGNSLEDQAQGDVNEILRPYTPPTTAPAAAENDATIVISDHVENEPKRATPKKLIKVTNNGKLLSSPPKPTPAPSSTPKKRRGRKPATVKVSPTVTIIKYGTDAATRLAFGHKVEAILNGKSAPAKRVAKPKKVSSKPVGPPKVQHPFFAGKPGSKKDAPPSSAPTEQRLPTPRKSAVTPGKLRAEARRDRSPGPTTTFGAFSKSARTNRQSGLNEASWPTKETAHVRNLDIINLTEPIKDQRSSALILKRRKLKNNVVSLPADEEIISRLACDLSQDMRSDNGWPLTEFEPPQDVRLPTRLLTTGIDIQRKVRDQVPSLLIKPGEQHIHGGTHPAIATLFNEIEHTLSPFDAGKCENQTWVYKYSPKYASHVLQAGNEAAMLKDWLQNLTVMAVGGALKSSSVSSVKKPLKKKRKKAVDDFIVWDDEEEEEDEDMITLADSESALNVQSRSFRRPHWTRNKNVVLISGPHGCGKSALVYAVAKELGFEVFEINSGVRRSGRDIQDKVGDMTANHLVNHSRSATPVRDGLISADDTDNERMDTALRKDLDSGRQGTMTSFFQANGVAQAKPKAIEKIQELPKAPMPVTQASLLLAPAMRKSQKQSLILFEEADILFEEDQQFWAQVTRLASQSKRPIVITCNSERQIPIQDLPLAAILRLQPPPIDLATDYMLVLAGREGHILERNAVSDLYKSKNYDLRASITELDFWCQMSVGDRKGGLEWMYQRWPPGKDVDEDGRLLRVASEGTYQSGMGWLSHNVCVARDNIAFDKNEELLKEVWTDWGISPVDWASRATNTGRSSDRSGHLRDLERLDTFTESLSAADMYCRVGLPTYDCDHDQPADPALPLIPDKARLSYTLAAPLLQVDHRLDFLSLDTSLSAQTHLLLQRAYPDCSHHLSTPGNSQPSTPTQYAESILQSKDKQRDDGTLSRLHFSLSLDALAAPPDQMLLERTSYILTMSSFDRTFSIITLDLAPYIRSIVAHELTLDTQRIRLSSLLSAGGNGKRARTTRASRVALEGGVRETKRRDRWFEADLNFELVMQTAGKEWAGLGWKGESEAEEGTGSLAGTLDDAQSAEDVSMHASQEL